MQNIRRTLAALTLCVAGSLLTGPDTTYASDKQLVYLSAGIEAPFWRYVAKGAEAAAAAHGYRFAVLDSRNNAQSQLQNAQDAVVKGAAGLVLSPTDSSTAPAVLDIAARAGIPLSFAGIGTTSGDYTTFVTSDDEAGAFAVGQEMVRAFKAKGWENADIGLIQISQARQNGVERTSGFVKAVTEAGHKIVARNEMQLYTADETYRFAQDMLTAHPALRGIFVQTDTPTLGAVRAVDAMRRSSHTLIAAFDGTPEFIPLIKKGSILASGMQQPYLMGRQAAESVIAKINGQSPQKEEVLSILIVTADTIDSQLPALRENVFANELR